MQQTQKSKRPPRDNSPKVNYCPSDDINAAVKAAKLAWATEKEQTTPTTDEAADDNTGNNGGNTPDPNPGELEGA